MLLVWCGVAWCGMWRGVACGVAWRVVYWSGCVYFTLISRHLTQCCGW